MLKEKKDVCFACIASNKSTTCVHETNQKASTDKLVERALKMLSSTNFSPPFNAVTPNLYIGDLRSFFQPPAECTHVLIFCLLDRLFHWWKWRSALLRTMRDVICSSKCATIQKQTSKGHRIIVFLFCFFFAQLNLVSQVLEEISSFGSGEKDVVLVHCIEGRSRSAAVVIGLLMKRQNRSFDEAFAEVKKVVILFVLKKTVLLKNYNWC
jgi:hypothetical protein